MCGLLVAAAAAGAHVRCDVVLCVGMQRLDAAYEPLVYTQGTLEGYVTGRMIVDTLQETRTMNSQGFVSAVYK